MAERKKAAEGKRDSAGAGRGAGEGQTGGAEENGGRKSRRKSTAAAVEAPAEPTKKGRGAGRAARAVEDTVAPAAESGEESAKPKKSPRSGGGRARSTGKDLKKDLKDFVSARPHGWGHEDWLKFLEDLRDRGHNIEDREAIGLALEQERLDHSLSRVTGLPEAARRPLLDRFKTVWSLRNAGVDEIAAVGGISRDVADRIKAEI